MSPQLHLLNEAHHMNENCEKLKKGLKVDLWDLFTDYLFAVKIIVWLWNSPKFFQVSK